MLQELAQSYQQNWQGVCQAIHHLSACRLYLPWSQSQQTSQEGPQTKTVAQQWNLPPQRFQLQPLLSALVLAQEPRTKKPRLVLSSLESMLDKGWGSRGNAPRHRAFPRVPLQLVEGLRHH